MGFITTTADSISSGGTVTGDLTIDADLTVTGSTAITVNEVIQGTSTIDVDSTTALLVRKNGAAGDVFKVDTTNSDLYITGDLDITGSITNATWTGDVIASAYLDSDTAHLSGTQTFSGAKTFSDAVTVGADGSGHDVTFHSGTAGDSFVWDASEEKLTITGTSGQTALDIADGNLVVAKDVKILDAGALTLGTDGDAQIWNDGSNTYIRNNTSDQDIIFRVNDGGVANTEVLRIDGATGAIGMNTDTPSSGCLELASRKLKLSGTGTGWSQGMIGMQDNVLNIMGGSSGVKIFPDGSGATNSDVNFANGKMGIGVTPKAWTVFTVLQLSTSAVLTGRSGTNQLDLANNWFHDGAEKRINTGYAVRYTQSNDGEHQFWTAGTDSANSSITFTSNMVIDNDSRISLSNNDAGLYNTIFGNDVGDPVSGQDHNTFIGHNVAATGTMTNAADKNTVVGSFAFNDVTSGHNNVAIGYDSLTAVNTGHSNVAIGAGAGDALVNGVSNVIIGKDAEANATDGGNCIVIGATAVGQDNNSVTLGNADVTATYLASGAVDDNILHIGKASPSNGANTDMSVGITINQGANDDEILAFKSSDVSHAMTAEAEADTYGKFYKHTGNAGGLQISGLRDADGVAEGALSLTGLLGEAADTTKSTSGGGVINLTAVVTNGSTGVTGVGSDGNLVVIHNAGTARFIFDAEGSGHADVEWVAFSDSRLKSSIEDVPYGLAEVLQLQPKRFDKQSGCFDENGDIELEDNKRRMIGFLAQDVKAIIPEIVKDVDETDSFYSMDDGKLMAVLVKAVQELTAKVEELEAK